MVPVPDNSTGLWRAFAQDFFAYFGAKVYPDEDEIMVDLPPELVDHFGKSRLYLIFPKDDGTSRPLNASEDLLVYGSKTFERMQALLQEKGEISALVLEKRYPLLSDTLTPPPLAQPQYKQFPQNEKEFYQDFLVVNYRAIFMSDERQEQCFSLVLDKNNHLRPELVPLLSLPEAFSFSEAPESLSSTMQEQRLNQAAKLAQSLIAPQIEVIQTATQNRLQKAVARLENFYQALQDDINSADAAKDAQIRADLNQELARKIQDELLRFQLKVELIPLSYAQMRLPFGLGRLRISGKEHEQTLHFWRDLYSKQTLEIQCLTCGQALLDPREYQSEFCRGACLLQEKEKLWASLSLLGENIRVNALPTMVNTVKLKPEAYQWWRLDTRQQVLFFGYPKHIFRSAVLFIQEQNQTPKNLALGDKLAFWQYWFRQFRK